MGMRGFLSLELSFGRQGMAFELSIVVPTYNERENIRPLLSQIDSALQGIAWEIIFVDDDSPDGTSETIREISKSDPRIRLLQRIGRRGLSSACVEGMLASSAEYLSVMDADLQHDASLLGRMIETLKKENLDLVVGSRYVQGGGVGEWSQQRAMMSRFATRLSRLIVRADLKDPMSGFFMVKRSFFHQVARRLSTRGFKILLDIFASSTKEVRFKELPFQFGQRVSGESKLNKGVLFEYVLLIIDKLLGRFLPTRFILFALVGMSGVGVNVMVLGLGLKVFHYSFTVSQIAATWSAMTSNFYLNNIFTFSDLKLKGLKFFRGLLLFYFACGIGAVVNVCMATYLFKRGSSWWLAGIIGTVIGSILNFSISATFTWREKKQ